MPFLYISSSGSENQRQRVPVLLPWSGPVGLWACVFFWLIGLGGCLTARAQSAPGGVSTNLTLWLKADAGTSPTTNGSAVASWVNQISGGGSLPSITPAQQPLFRSGSATQGFNFNPSISFDGVDDRFAGGSNYGVQGAGLFTSIVVARRANQSNFHMVWGSSSTANDSPSYYFNWNEGLQVVDSRVGTKKGTVQHASATPLMVGISRTAATSFQHYSNGSTDGAAGNISSFGGNFTNANLNIGYRLDYPFNGEIAELLIYDAALNAADLQKVHSYLAIKYGFTLPTSFSYVASDGASIWNDATYGNDITGIGRDDAAGLNQKQSRSVNAGALVTFSNGTAVAASNALNSSTFAVDNAYNIVGDNGQSTLYSRAYVPQTYASPVPSAFRLMARIWRVRESGTVGTVTVSVPASTKADVLIVSSTASFTGTNTEIALTPDGNGNMTGQVDLSDGQFFTFGATLRAPGGIAGGLNLWLRADAGSNTSVNSGTVSSWTDQSVFGATATGFNAPTYLSNANNFNPAMSLAAGSPKYFALPTGFNNFTNGLSAYVVAKPTASNNMARFFDFGLGQDNNNILLYRSGTSSELTYFVFNGSGSGGNFTSTTGPIVNDENRVFSVFQNAGAAGVGVPTTTFVNSLSVATGSVQVPPIINRTANFIGRSNWAADAYYNGEISEVILYNNNIQADRHKIESYLAIKYGLTLPTSFSSYVASTGTTIWNNVAYWKNIGVVGRDDASALLQKQSASVNTDNQLSIGLGVLATSNATNPNSFTADLSFMAWGAKDEATPFADMPNNVDTRLARMAREWRIKETGTVGNVAVRIENLPVSATKVFLLRDANGDFTSGATATDVTSSYANGVLSLSAVDFADGEVFTIGYVIPAPGGVLTGLNLWLRADAGVTSTTAGAVQTWVEQSESLKNAVSRVGAVSAVAGVMNFNPVLRFAGNADLLVPKFLVATDDVKFSAFALQNATSNQGTIWGSPGSADANNKGFEWGHSPTDLYTAAAYNQYFFTLPSTYTYDGIPDILNVIRTPAGGGSPAQFYANGAGGTVAVTNPATPAKFKLTGDQLIGSRNNDLFFTGDIPELIVYTTNVGLLERKRIQSYLAIKYGVTLSPSVNSYLLSDETVLWSNADYWKNIAGIVRDDASGLHQRQARSVNPDETLTIGLGTIATTNVSNPNSFTTDKSFMVWGAKDEANPEADMPTGLATNLVRLPREWLFRKQGANLPVALRMTNLPPNAYRLFLLRDPDGNFTDANSTDVTSSFSNGVLSLSGLNFADGEYFTLGFVVPSPGGVLRPTSGTLISGQLHVNGLEYTLYDRYDSTPENGITGTIISQGYANGDFNFDDVFDTKLDVFSLELRGKLLVSNVGTYQFRFQSLDDDGSIHLDGQLVHSADFGVSTPTTVTLAAGYHDIMIRFSDIGGTNTLQMQYSGPDNGNIWTQVPDNRYFVRPVGPSAWFMSNDAAFASLSNGAITPLNTIWPDRSIYRNDTRRTVGGTQGGTKYSSTTGLTNFNPTLTFFDDRFDKTGYLNGFAYGLMGKSMFADASINVFGANEALMGWGHGSINSAQGLFKLGDQRISYFSYGDGVSGLTPLWTALDQSYLVNTTFQNNNLLTNNNARLLVNGGLVNQGTKTGWNTRLAPNEQLTVGNSYWDAQSLGWNGNINELVVYPWTLSSTEQLRINSYLALKWGKTLNHAAVGNELVSNGTFNTDLTSWSATGNLGVLQEALYFNGGQTTPDGVIWQNINTQANGAYQLRYDAGTGGSGSAGGVVGVRAEVIDVATSTTLASQTATYTAGSASNQILSFTAASATTRIRFTDISPNTFNIDASVDNVSVTDGPNGIPAGVYLASDGSTRIWDGTPTGYHLNVAGIGRDDVSGLDQKQSASINSDNELAIGLTSLAVSNSLNTASFGADKNFMVWGAKDEANPNADMPASLTALSTRIAREWRVQETGTVGNVTLRLTNIPHNVRTVWLLRDMDGNFTNATTTNVTSNVNSGTLTLSNLDFANGEHFTVAYLAPGPGGVSQNLNLWLRADIGTSTTANGAGIAAWVDQSASGINAVQSTTANQPRFFNQTLDQANFNPVINFDGTTDHFSLPASFADFTAGLSAFSVHQFTNNSGFARIFDFGNGQASSNIILARNNANTYLNGINLNGNATLSSVDAPAGTLFQTAYGLAGFNIGSGNPGAFVPAQLLLNGVQSVTATMRVPDNVSRASNFIGRSNWGSDGYFGGIQPELIVFNRQLPAIEQLRVNSYLAIKYGLTLAPTSISYVASDGITAVWNDTGYWNNITVIGRDDKSDLVQRQSRSVSTSAIVTMGVGTLAQTNQTNPGSFSANLSFLAFGDDGRPLSWTVTGRPASNSAYQLLGRTFRVKETGTVGGVVLSAAASRLPALPNASRVYLSISNTASFTSGATFIPLSETLGEWATATPVDFTDGQYFTFAISPEVSVSVIQATCTSNTANSNGTIIVSPAGSLTGTVPRLGFSMGGIYTGPAFASATATSVLPVTLVSNLPNPTANTPYTVRAFLSADTYRDYSVLLLPQVCTTANLSLSLTPPTQTGAKGVPLTYVLTLTNTGPNPAVNVVVSVPLPEPVARTLSVTPASGTYNSITREWTVPNLPVGSTTLSFTISVN